MQIRRVSGGAGKLAPAIGVGGARGMRHSSFEVAMNIYTDADLLDVAGAIDVLPSFSTERPSRPSALATTSAM